MGNKYRLSLLLIRQIVFGIAYVNKTVYIGLLCFNLNINCQKQEMGMFRFVNLLRR